MLWIGIAIAIVLVITIIIFAFPSRTPSTQQSQDTDSSIPGTTHIVEITSTGFVPKTFTISKGDSVTWVNKYSSPSWPASAAHPTHTIYPGSGVQKCGTSEEKNIFDACRGLAENEQYTFTFNESGSWNYHDHLNPSRSGRVIVQ